MKTLKPVVADINQYFDLNWIERDVTMTNNVISGTNWGDDRQASQEVLSNDRSLFVIHQLRQLRWIKRDEDGTHSCIF